MGDLSRPINEEKRKTQKRKRKSKSGPAMETGPDTRSARGALLPGARLQGCKNSSVQGHEISP